MSDNPINNMAAQSQAISNAVAGGILGMVANAAESIVISNTVAAMQARGEALMTALESISESKDALIKKAEGAKGALKIAFARQIQLLTEQEAKILEKMGAATDTLAPPTTKQKREALPVNRLEPTNGYTVGS